MNIDEFDSFITLRNQKTDLEKMQRTGEEAYNSEQIEKRQILDRLLSEYNDGSEEDAVLPGCESVAVGGSQIGFRRWR